MCVNPDRVTVSPSGVLTYVPGQLAKRYEELGGKVHYFGKPYPGASLYVVCLSIAPFLTVRDLPVALAPSNPPYTFNLDERACHLI